MLGDRAVGRLDEIRPDMPWFVSRFAPTEAFAEVELLFQRELSLTEAEDFDAEAWEAAWEDLWRRGLALLLPDGRRLERDFAVHVYDDGTARFRY
jgi:hypothetical protein